ncbi:high-affinity nickel-transporter protein [Haladaptatus pallidirubidus]|uniref:Nickel/cobalt efflux system n=1 Tax=Haladaptatus pallidirubidus TaxID=1008152 RepID=A0AAV3UJN2_9EURY|nr:hypothetical protein [Haladaptatus pallidirubidus]
MVGISLLVEGIGTGFLIGGAFGARHAFEADHVAAVATLIEGERRPATTGATWGIGHSLPIVFLGAIFLTLDLQIPSGVATAFELLVAVILVILGLRVLAGRKALGITILRHMHGGKDNPDSGHTHMTIGNAQMGFLHSHGNGGSLAVGIVHGLAGSGGVVVALAAASPTVAGGVAFLVGFSIASVIAMGAASWTWGQAIGQTRKLRILAGIASITVGLLLFVEIIGFIPTA